MKYDSREFWGWFCQPVTRSFYENRFQKQKNRWLYRFFAVLLSVGVKAAHKALVKLTPEVTYISEGVTEPLTPIFRNNSLSFYKIVVNKVKRYILRFKSGVGKSFGFAGLIKNKLGIRGQYMSIWTDFKIAFKIRLIFPWCLMCFYSQYSHLENFKCGSRATLRCLAGLCGPRAGNCPCLLWCTSS
jgi:hypothetical protein